RIRSPSILEPRVGGYPLTFIAKGILVVQTVVLTIYLVIHLFISDKPEPLDVLRICLYVVTLVSVITFFFALRLRKWILLIPLLISEIVLLAYNVFVLFQVTLKDIIDDKTGIYVFLAVLVILECPLTIYLSIRVLLYMRTMDRAVKTTRQLSYVGSITKETLRKEAEMVERRRAQSMKIYREEVEMERIQRQPRISVISLPLEEREPSTSTTSSHVEVSDA
ncbi:hypothetical protein PFISCL1PPCAC_27006, partial [Pristionchus fissidentatus]